MPEESPAAHAALSAVEPEAWRVLLILHRTTEPIGARHAARTLAAEGPTISEATVSRVFTKLDELGFTQAVERKGRILTNSGRRQLDARLSEQRRNAEFGKALNIRTIQQLMDWLHARRGIESELARLAATRAEPADLHHLEDLLAEHQQAVDADANPTPIAMRFHVELAKAANSPLLETLLATLRTDTLAPLEQLLDTITSGHGTVGRSTDEHTLVLQALQAGEADAADEAMHRHLDRLITEVAEFAEGSSAELLPKLLRLLPENVPHY